MKKCIICGKPLMHGQIINKQVVCKECAEAATKHDEEPAPAPRCTFDE